MDVRLLAALTAESLAELNVTAVCAEHGISRKTFYKWRGRFLAEGLEGLEPRSRRPRTSPRRLPTAVEDEIVRLRKQLAEEGLDAGPATIQWHLQQRADGGPVPSVATIWRVLVRRGQVTPAPRKRPRASLRRFEAARPNQLWQIDATDWTLQDGQTVSIINIIDDHSRLAVASRAVASATSPAAWDTFAAAVETWGLPVGCLSDNGLAFSGRLRGFEVTFETNLRAHGVRPICSRPYHPQTCGKVERCQQTLKHWLAAHGPHPNLAALQSNLNTFCDYYNHHRPHRAIDRTTPYQRWTATPPATPNPHPLPATGTQRRTRLRVNDNGIAQTHRWAIHLGVIHAGQTADLITNGTHAAIYIDGTLIRHLQLDPTRRYQPSGRKRGGPRQPRPTDLPSNRHP